MFALISLDMVADNLDKRAMERSDEKRLAFNFEVGQYSPNHLVFVDESSCNRRIACRDYGLSMSGTTAVMSIAWVQGQR